jgi:CBS domain-containing protein
VNRFFGPYGLLSGRGRLSGNARAMPCAAEELTMKAREIMTVAVVTVRPDTPIRVAAALLTDRGIASLPVVDDDGRLVGIVSEMDLIGDRLTVHDRFEPLRLNSEQADPAPEVRAVMTTAVVCLGAGADTADLAALMQGSHIRAVPIVEGSRLVGIASRRDLLRSLVPDSSVIRAEVLERIRAYTGVRDGWELEVDNGVVTIEGRFTDTAREAIIVELARTVPGVLHVHVYDAAR